MSRLGTAVTFGRMFRLLMLDLAAGCFAGWLIIDNPHRWPAVAVLLLPVLLINLVVGRRIVAGRSERPLILPIIYAVALLFGLWWIITGFEWWKVLLLLVPLALIVVNLQRFKRDPSMKPGGGWPGAQL
jgi:hypothetical protein